MDLSQPFDTYHSTQGFPCGTCTRQFRSRSALQSHCRGRGHVVPTICYGSLEATVDDRALAAKVRFTDHPVRVEHSSSTLAAPLEAHGWRHEDSRINDGGEQYV